MGLFTDKIFFEALKADTTFMQAVGNRLYGTAIPVPDDNLESVPVPYCIVTFDGLNNQNQTKDDVYEGSYDTVNIGVEVIGETINDLHELTQAVRDTILSYFRENETAVSDYAFTADAIQYDSLKPCYWQTLRYQCEVYNLNDDEQD